VELVIASADRLGRHPGGRILFEKATVEAVEAELFVALQPSEVARE